jgi:chaperone required for assembly of F1-ATPase
MYNSNLVSRIFEQEAMLICKSSVVFSYWTTTLDLIESMLKSEAITFTRIDGEMSGSQRTEAIEKFQKYKLSSFQSQVAVLGKHNVK